VDSELLCLLKAVADCKITDPRRAIQIVASAALHLADIQRGIQREAELRSLLDDVCTGAIDDADRIRDILSRGRELEAVKKEAHLSVAAKLWWAQKAFITGQPEQAPPV
jgi:hypothetical protein